MTIDINQYWNLLSESQLVQVSTVQTLFTEFAEESSIPKTSESLGDWLIEKKAITGYQARILSAGHNGPFRYGNYTVNERIESGPMKGHFAARHLKTGYLVLLQFVGGTETEHLQHWKNTETLCDSLAGLEHPNLANIFETVRLADYRFVVSKLPSGKSLSDKLPRKARLPWKKACALVAQVANGLTPIHELGIIHNAVTPRTIWLLKNGSVELRVNAVPDLEFEKPKATEKGSESKHDYLAPECYGEDVKLTPACDIYSLGCVLVRMVTGRPVFQAETVLEKRKHHEKSKPADLSKYEIPAELESLITKMLAKSPTDRPASAKEVCNVLGLISGTADQIKALKINVSPKKKAYLDSINEFLPGTDELVASVPEISSTDTSESVESGSPKLSPEERAAKIKAAADAAQKRKQGKWKVPAAIAGSLLALSVVIAALALNASQTVVEKEGESTDPNNKDSNATTQVETTSTETVDVESLPPEQRPTVIQELIADDDSSLWETPTNGPPSRFSYLPVTPKILCSIRPSEMVSQLEGQLLLRCLGPDFSERINSFVKESGFELENIDRLTISLHSSDELEYRTYFVVELDSPIKQDRLIENWNRPQLEELSNQEEIYKSRDGNLAYYVLPTETSDTGTDGSEAEDTEEENTPEGGISDVTRFAFGPADLVEEVALSAGATVLSGSMRNLADWTDNDRHINVMFLRNALFNDEGQKLMGEAMLPINRDLRIMIPDDVRGGLLSLHVDSGSYVELMFDRNFDLKALELKETMEDAFRQKRDQITTFVATIPSNAYWDKVRVKYDNMISDLHRNLRWDVEHGEVTANCWLPPMAAHNLIASSELVVSFAGGATQSAAPTKKVPQSLEELLAIKRDLNIANPPDLNVLMADLQTEILDDYGRLPFPFNIRLIGGDLEKDGITKNQRPSELIINQKSLAEILTSIMVKANPDKDITGPADVDCKLIWVIAEDPDTPGEMAILITTRSAAAEKGYDLPASFRAE